MFGEHEWQVKQAFQLYMTQIGVMESWHLSQEIKLSDNDGRKPDVHSVTLVISNQFCLDFIVLWWNEHQTPILLMQAHSVVHYTNYILDLKLNSHVSKQWHPFAG